MKYKIKSFKLFVNENIQNIEYYTSSSPMTINEFIETEVEERENYDIDEVNEWIKKYKIDSNDEIIWVALEPHIAAHYQMIANDWDNAKEIYESNPNDFNVNIINSKDGFLIPESDDGDDGFIFVFRKQD